MRIERCAVMRCTPGLLLWALLVTQCAPNAQPKASEDPAPAEHAKPPPAHEDILRVVLPRPRPGDQARFDYLRRVLEMALEHTKASHGPYEIVLGPDLSQGRQMLALREGRDDLISIVAVGTSREYEQSLTPVRFPLFRGLLGHRVCLIHASRQPEFSRVRTLDQFKRFSIGQQHHWTDVPILHAAGITVVGAPRYDVLFPMLLAGRFDCFSRGVLEAYAEWEERKDTHPDLAVERDLLLSYKQAELFFTKPGDDVLAPRLRVGLQRALDDGSFLELFERHPAVRPALDMLQAHPRRVFHVDNPQLSRETEAVDPRLWLDLDSLMARHAPQQGDGPQP